MKRRDVKNRPAAEAVSTVLLTVSVALLATGQPSLTGLQILSNFTQLQSINDFPMQSFVGDAVAYSPGTYPFALRRTNGTIGRADVVVDRAFERYDFYTRLHCPADAFLTQGQACLAQNPNTYNASLLASGTVSSFSGQPQPSRNTTFNSGLGDFWGSVSSLFQTVACTYANSATLGIVGALGGPCSGGNSLSVEAFARYAQSQQTMWAAQNAFNGGVTSWIGTATDQFKNLVSADEQILKYQTANTWVTGNLTKLYTGQQIQINQLINETSAGLNYIQSELVSTNANTQLLADTISSLAQATVSTFNTTLAQFAQTTAYQGSWIANLSSQVTTLQRDSMSKDMTTQQTFSVLAASLTASITQSQFLTPLVQLFSQNRQTVAKLNEGGGVNFQLFLTNLGSQGVLDPYHITNPDLVKLVIDAPQLAYIYTVGVPPSAKAVAATTQIELNCGGLWLSLNDAPMQSWSQLLNSLGIPGQDGCTVDTDPITGQGTNFCNCWMRITEQGCNMRGGGSTTAPTAEALAAWNAWDNPGFPANISTFCSGPIFFPTQELIIRNSSDFAQWQQSLCLRGVNPVIPGYKVFSPLFRSRYLSPYSTLGCSGDLLGIMNPVVDAGTNFNVMYSVMRFLVSAFTMSGTSVQLIRGQILGTPPLNTTIDTEYFQQLSAGPMGVCNTMYAMSYDMDNWLRVRRWVLAPFTATVKVYIDGELFSTSNDWTLDNPNADKKIPNGAYVGMDDHTFNDYVYDIAYSSVTPDPNALANQGDPTYYCIRSESEAHPVFPTTYNLDIWRSYYVFPFDHRAGSTAWSIFKVGLTCDHSVTPPRCVCNGNRGTGADGTICDALDWYTFDTTLSTDYILAYSTTNYLRGTLTLPQGQLVALSGSACATVTRSTAIGNDYSIQTLNLYNGLSTVNTIEVQRDGKCGGVDRLTLQPLENYPYPVIYCAQQPGVPVNLTFYNFAGGVRTLCNTTYQVLITPTNPTVSINGTGATFVATEKRLLVANDQALINAQQVSVQSALTMISLVQAVIQVMANNYMAPAQTGDPLGAFAVVFTQINTTQTLIANTLTASQNYTFSYPQSLLNYSAINQGLLDQIAVANQAAQNASSALAAIIQKSQVNLAKLIEQNGNVIALMNASTTTLTWLNGVVNDIIEEELNKNPSLSLDDILAPLGTFLSGVAALPVEVAQAAVGFLGDVSDTFSKAVGGLFGSVGNLFGSIVLILGGGAVLGILCYVIYQCVKKMPEEKTRDTSVERRLQALEKATGIVTGGMRRRRTGGEKKKKEDDKECCSCCSGPSYEKVNRSDDEGAEDDE